MIGEVNKGIRTLRTTPLPLIAEKPYFITKGPISPPIIAWDELDGILTTQVMRFQTIAPRTAAQTIIGISAE